MTTMLLSILLTIVNCEIPYVWKDADRIPAFPLREALTRSL